MGRIAHLKAAARRAAVSSALRLQRTDELSVYYNAFNGHFADNPRAIFEELRSRDAGFTHVWRASLERPARFPDDVRAVVPNTLAHARGLNGARYVIANGWMTSQAKPKNTTWVQTWHGTPLKRIAFDKASGLDLRWSRHLASDVAKWDYLISPNRFSTPLFRQAFRYDGPVLETGYPRNDVLNAPHRADIASSVRRELGIADDQTAVLYAPTWRDELRDANGKHIFPIPFDLTRFGDHLGDDHVLLIRLHRAISSPGEHGGRAFTRDVSAYADIRDLYLVADVLVTDYSSVMFDFAVTGKPILFFTHDIASYRDDLRGFYFDLEAEAPGPLLETTDALIEGLGSLDAMRTRYAERYRAFRYQFCTYDDGHASRRVVDAVFGNAVGAA